MGCFSIFLHCSIITRQVNEISGRIAQIITFVSLSSPTSIVYSVFCLFFFFGKHLFLLAVKTNIASHGA